jgi:hypothetical protein
MRLMRAGVVLVPAVAVMLFLSMPLHAETREVHLTFSSTHQSMWGPGGALPPIKTRFTIINPNTVQFDVSSPNYPALQGPFATVDTFFWGDVDFGIGARARAAARLGLFADIAVPNAGSVDVTYPINSVLTFPDANSFRAGDTVTIGSSYSTPTGWQMTTISPKAEFELKGDFALHLDMYAKACVVACLDTPGVLGIPSPLANVDTGEFRIFRINTDSSVTTPPALGLVSPISGDMHVPNINTTGTLASNNRSLVANGSDEFVNVSLDLGSIAEDLFRLPPLSFNTADFGDFDAVSGLHFHYLIAGSNANAHVAAVQDFRFDPDPKITFTFTKPLRYAINSGAETTGSTAEMKVGDTLHLVTPPEKTPMPVAPQFRLDNQFHSETSVELREDVDVSAGSLGLTIPEVTIIPELCTPGFCVDFGLLGEACVPEICTPEVNYDPPDFDIGPLYSRTFPIAQQKLGTIVSGSWQMGGFSTLGADSLSIDPENPIVAVEQLTGATRNLGNGRRMVVFAVDIRNPGDVTLSKLSLKSHLLNAFANARSFTVDRIITCGLDLNPNFDGKTDEELLATGNTLAPAATKRVYVYAIVSPQPDPETYVMRADTEGRSPLDTLVSSNGSSNVFLGQSNPQSADDFVLYGDNFVKFDSAGDVSGHVGSNNSIEIKLGTSGNVAGDLRAARYIKVSGEVSADYALSGGVVDVVGKGRLTLFGNYKQFQQIASFSTPSAPWAPTTAYAGNVWVPANGSVALAPGYYGAVTVNSGSTLQLRPGTYYINQLDVGSDASVALGSSVNVVVGKSLQIGNNANIAGTGSTRDASIDALQTDDITTGSNAFIRAKLVAPRSNLIFGAFTRIEGAAYGKSITLNRGVSVGYHRDCDRLIDANCDGSPDCP